MWIVCTSKQLITKQSKRTRSNWCLSVIVLDARSEWICTQWTPSKSGRSSWLSPTDEPPALRWPHEQIKWVPTLLQSLVIYFCRSQFICSERPSQSRRTLENFSYLYTHYSLLPWMKTLLMSRVRYRNCVVLQYSTPCRHMYWTRRLSQNKIRAGCSFTRCYGIGACKRVARAWRQIWWILALFL